MKNKSCIWHHALWAPSFHFIAKGLVMPPHKTTNVVTRGLSHEDIDQS